MLIGMGICLIAIIITINDNYRPTAVLRTLSRVIAPLQSGMTNSANWVSSRFSLFWEMDAIQADNERLLQENGLLRIENQRLQLAGEENQRLAELLYIRQRYAELPIIGATIIGWDPADWYVSFRIDRGSNDGLARNMSVLGAGGLVGVLHEVYPTSAQVTAITDDRFRVAVQSVRTGDTGIITGDSTLMRDGLIRMEYISDTADIMAGDELITSAEISYIFPSAIRVGTVLEVHPTPDRLAQSAIVSPFAIDIRNMEHVIVVTQLFDADAEAEAEE